MAEHAWNFWKSRTLGRGDDEPGAKAFGLLLSPFSIRNVGLRNRFVFQPHFTALADIDGTPSEALAAYHEERARGGAGLIILESQAIHPSGKMSRRFIDAWDPKIIPHHRRVTDGVHRFGAKIFGQLTHGGHTSLEHPPHILWAPTQMPEPSSHFTTKAMDVEDIRAVIEGFARSARNLIDAGFDGIEIKVAHDGLLRSFASPYFNRRTDGYGGSFENRLRLSLEVLEAIRKTVDAAPLGVRLCVNEFTSFGYDSDYGIRMAEMLQSSGLVDYFNSDAGSFSSYWMEIPPAAVAAEDLRKINAELKRCSKLPVIAFGRMNSPQAAEEVLQSGEADLIGMARQLIADPYTPEKTRLGRADLVRRCIACNDACVYQVGQEKAVRCVQNPGAGREREVNERFVARAEKRRQVVIVGGGPAGLKAAETAALRGHHVTLLERQRELGGQLLYAARQPEHANVADVTRYLERACQELGVDLRRGVTVTPEVLLEFAAEALICATGSEPNLPRTVDDNGEVARGLGRQALPGIPGLDRDFVVSSDEVLAGAVQLRGNIVVIDDNGHWEAAGTAEYLADRGCAVEVIAAHPMIGIDLEAGTRTLYYRRAAIKGIKFRTSTSLVAIGDHCVTVAPVFSGNGAVGWDRYLLLPGDEQRIDDVDAVVAVIGRRSREDLYLAVKDDARFHGVQIERIGDCVAPRLIESTIAEAFLLAQSL
ncbi:MAG: FAD-dependent oxidoreductase [Pseudomonadota bacterium]|nr:FAD-dependent oxidoreductase [Pseudomonadota bacterium]